MCARQEAWTACSLPYAHGILCSSIFVIDPQSLFYLGLKKEMFVLQVLLELLFLCYTEMGTDIIRVNLLLRFPSQKWIFLFPLFSPQVLLIIFLFFIEIQFTYRIILVSDEKPGDSSILRLTRHDKWLPSVTIPRCYIVLSCVPGL